MRGARDVLINNIAEQWRLFIDITGDHPSELHVRVDAHVQIKKEISDMHGFMAPKHEYLEKETLLGMEIVIEPIESDALYYLA